MTNVITSPLTVTETDAPAIPEVKLPNLEPETIERLGQLLIGVCHDGAIPALVIRGAHLVDSEEASVEQIKEAMKQASEVVLSHAERGEVEHVESSLGRPIEGDPDKVHNFNNLHVDGQPQEPVRPTLNITEDGGTHVLVARAQSGVTKVPNTKELLGEGNIHPTEVVPGSLAQTRTPLGRGDTIALPEFGTHHHTGEEIGGGAHLFNVAPGYASRTTIGITSKHANNQPKTISRNLI